MTDQEVLALLRRIDGGFEPTEEEKVELSKIKKITWKNIEDIPESIDILINLKGLDVSGDFLYKSRLMTIPKSIGKLTNLQSLNLSNTYLSVLPDSIGNLMSLQSLELGHTELSELPDSIGNLTSLQSLKLSSTQLRELPDSIGDLTSLKSLDLSFTQLRELPESIGNLSELKIIVLEGLVLSELPESLLNLNIEYKDKEYDPFSDEPGIYINGLRLKNQPIEIFHQSRELILEYYESIKSKSTSPINECKVVFLGDGGAGKSLIIDRLINDGDISDNFDGESTPGICISSKKYLIGNEEIELHIWDFGGQAIMHSMHRLFLTNRTLYVVVTNARDNKANEQAWYWIRNIKSFANGAPVLLLVNQKDQNPSANVNENGLRKEYPELKQVRIVSALKDTKEEFDKEVCGAICQIVSDMETVHTPFPRSWHALMNDLQKMPGDVITSQEFYEKCKKYDVGTEKEQLDQIISWFQDLGVCFYSRKHPTSKRYMVVKPRWLLNALYILIFNGRSYAVNGVIKESDIYELICRKVSDKNVKQVYTDTTYKEDQIQYIITVLLNYELIYRLDEERIFIPMLCDENEPYALSDFGLNNAQQINFEYAYLPENVLHRLIVRHGNELDLGMVWRTGAVFERKDTKWNTLARIKDNTLELYVNAGNQEVNPANSYLEIIRESVYEINKDYGLSATEYISYWIDGTRYSGRTRTENILDVFFHKYTDSCPSFATLQQFIKEESLDLSQDHPNSGLDDLFRFNETQDTDHRKTQELLELLWKLYLMDSNHVKKVEIIDSSTDIQTDNIYSKSNEKELSSTNERNPKVTQKSSAHSDDESEQYKPKPSELEDATKLVLDDFQKWWEEKADRMGLTFSIVKTTTKQKSGNQYGYDVGLNTEFGGLKYRLRFECKDYTSNISDGKQGKTTDLNVRSYAYNLLEYFMFCESRVNMRWILICPFGGLQNDFPERLFEHWNEEHTFIKIYAIMENGPAITCKDFLSVNKDAYRKIYKKDYDGDKTKDDVFKYLYDKIIGTDDVREAALKRLKKYVFWEEYGGHKGLLPVPDRTSQVALKQIISFLQRKKEGTDNEQKKTLFVIGEYGTGKSWLCYRVIEQIVFHPNDFPFMPFYLRLKDLSQNTDLEDRTQYKDIMIDTLRESFEKYDEWVGECVRKALQPVFFLDGFDEVFSGLAATDKKIHFLLSIISELKDWYEKHENERDIKKHTKPLFVITSRESDFEVGTKSEDFQIQMKQAEVIELEMCSVDEVQKEWNKLEEEDHTDRSWIFKLEQNSAFLNIIRRPVFYRLCSEALKDDTFKQKVDLASVDEFDVLDMLFEYELQNYAREEKINKNEIRREIFECAVECSRKKKSKVVYAGKGINHKIHVGMVKIEKDQKIEGTCWVSFEHNIVREYLTARFLSQCLIDCPPEEIEDPMKTTFVQTLQELSLTPEALKFLLLCLEKKSPRDKGKRYKELLKKWLCNRSIKRLDSRLPARLLEILLQPGCTLSGEKEERLDLAELHASDLCLWNCGMRHVNLSNAELKNWQMINMVMDDVDLRKANMKGLRLAPDKPISSLCQWKDTKEWHVATLHKNGQLVQYNFPNNSWKQYSAEVLSKTGVNDGVLRFSNELMLYSEKKLYDEKENELYQIRSNNNLERIVIADGLCGFITKQGDKYQVVIFQGDMAPIAFSLGKIEQRNIILTKSGQVLFVQDGVIKLISQNGETRQLCKWDSGYECFTAPLIINENACIYIKCDDSLIRIAFDEEMHEVKSLRKVLQIQEDFEKMRELRVLNESALAAVGKNELYILSIEKINDEEIVKSRRLKTAIKITNSVLEDEDGRNRVQDNDAYELLLTSMR